MMLVQLGPFDVEINEREIIPFHPSNSMYLKVLTWFADRPCMATVQDRIAFLEAAAPDLKGQINVDQAPYFAAMEIINEASKRGLLKEVMDAAGQYQSVSTPAMTPQQMVRIAFYSSELGKLGVADLRSIAGKLGLDTKSVDKPDFVFAIMDHVIAANGLDGLGKLIQSSKSV